MCPNKPLLAISNLKTGFDVYNLSSGSPSYALDNAEENEGYPLPVLFIHGGNAIIGGSSCGSVCIWDAESARALDNDFSMDGESWGLIMPGAILTNPDRFGPCHINLGMFRF